jgi:hypothetical protein
MSDWLRTTEDQSDVLKTFAYNLTLVVPSYRGSWDECGFKYPRLMGMQVDVRWLVDCRCESTTHIEHVYRNYPKWHPQLSVSEEIQKKDYFTGNVWVSFWR